MPKGRITVTFDYEMNPASYPAGATPQEMVAMDAESYNNMPDALLESIAQSGYTVTGAVIEE